METLRDVLYAGEDVSVWGYVTESGNEVRLGRIHYAERICSELGKPCVQMHTTQITLISRTVPIGEGKTFQDFLMCDYAQFQNNLSKR